MGLLCESVRGWRWQGGAGAFRAALGVLLLGLSLAQSVPPQLVCPAVAEPQSVAQPQYQDQAEEDTGEGFMAALVQSFLHTVQPNPFPEDLILTIVQDFDQVQLDEEIVREALAYEVGFLVCAVIGALYIVLMPIVGFVLACCRCCGNCGGKMYQKQTSFINCRRITLYWTAFVTTVIIFAGNICMFKSNEAVKVSVDQSQLELNKTIDNIRSFLTTVPQQVDHVVSESYRTVEEVSRNLDAIGPQLGGEINKQFRETLEPALRSVRLLDRETANTYFQLNKLNSSLVQLQFSMDRLQANVTAVRNNISQTLSKPDCNSCDSLQPELQKLTPDTSVMSPSLDEFQSEMDEIIKMDIQSKIMEVESYFNTIPQRVANDTKDIVQSSKQQLGDIKRQISQVTDDIPLSVLTNVSEVLNQLQREIGGVIPQVERAEYYRWAVCVALCCVVLLVVLCNLLGLVLGPLGLKPKAEPTQRSCTADCGGTFLMMGAGFSFLFSWLFMIVAVLLFLLGGNIYTLLCRPWNNGQLLKLIDTPGLIPGVEEIGPSLGLKTNINISDIYRDCEDNQSLWTTLHLYELINLDDLLNVSKYTEQITEHFDSTDITLSTVTLLSQEVKDQLLSFSNKGTTVDSNTFTQQINDISSINLNTTADKLDQLAAFQPSDTRKELINEAQQLRRIQANIETTIFPQLEALNSSIKSLESIAGQINRTVGEVLSNMRAAQDFLDTNTTQIVKTESRKFLDCQLSYFIVFADWANLTITQQVGQCGPVAGAVNSVEIILCAHMVESLNAFWFSLGWCLIFFIPSIILSIKLAKYYRRMTSSDVFDNNLAMNHIPRAQMKFY